MGWRDDTTIMSITLVHKCQDICIEGFLFEFVLKESRQVWKISIQLEHIYNNIIYSGIRFFLIFCGWAIKISLLAERVKTWFPGQWIKPHCQYHHGGFFLRSPLKMTIWIGPLGQIILMVNHDSYVLKVIIYQPLEGLGPLIVLKTRDSWPQWSPKNWHTDIIRWTGDNDRNISGKFGEKNKTIRHMARWKSVWKKQKRVWVLLEVNLAEVVKKTIPVFFGCWAF